MEGQAEKLPRNHRLEWSTRVQVQVIFLASKQYGLMEWCRCCCEWVVEFPACFHYHVAVSLYSFLFSFSNKLLRQFLLGPKLITRDSLRGSGFFSQNTFRKNKQRNFFLILKMIFFFIERVEKIVFGIFLKKIKIYCFKKRFLKNIIKKALYFCLFFV